MQGQPLPINNNSQTGLNKKFYIVSVELSC